jgi:hypothetical protein
MIGTKNLKCLFHVHFDFCPVWLVRVVPDVFFGIKKRAGVYSRPQETIQVGVSRNAHKVFSLIISIPEGAIIMCEAVRDDKDTKN